MRLDYKRAVRPHLMFGRAYGQLELRREGSRWRGPCPLCGGGERSRRFSVDRKSLAWYCHSCQAHLDYLAIGGGER